MPARLRFPVGVLTAMGLGFGLGYLTFQSDVSPATTYPQLISQFHESDCRRLQPLLNAFANYQGEDRIASSKADTQAVIKSLSESCCATNLLPSLALGAFHLPDADSRRLAIESMSSFYFGPFRKSVILIANTLGHEENSETLKTKRTFLEVVVFGAVEDEFDDMDVMEFREACLKELGAEGT